MYSGVFCVWPRERVRFNNHQNTHLTRSSLEAIMQPDDDIQSVEQDGFEENNPRKSQSHPALPISGPIVGEKGGGKMKKSGREPTKSVGVSLTTSEWARIDAIASNLRMKRGALLAYAVRLFLKLYESGQLTETSEVLKKL
jgi:hypothetical protein